MPDVHPLEEPVASRCGLLRRLGTVPWIVVLVRCLVGGVFILSGISKLLLAHAEVVALVQQYQVIPPWLAPVIAAGLPWLELGSGTALVIGFFTTPVTLLIATQLLGFSLLMLVVLLLGIPIDDCGCFGNLGLRETPLQVLIRDLLLLVLLLPVLLRQHDFWSLDAWGNPENETAQSEARG